MELGLFTCGYQYTNIESAFIDAAAFGYDFIELWGGRPHAWAPDMDAGRVAQLRELSARYAVPIRVYTPGDNGRTACAIWPAAWRYPPGWVRPAR